MELVTSAYFFRVFIWERDIEVTIPQSMEVATEKPSPRLRRGETLCDKKNQVTKMYAAKEAFALED
jgi:hypothetical protein